MHRYQIKFQFVDFTPLELSFLTEMSTLEGELVFVYKIFYIILAIRYPFKKESRILSGIYT